MEILVIGAGIAGLSAAISLAHSGHHLTVLEAQKELTPVGAGIQMPPNATKLFRGWGILDKIKEKATIPSDVSFRSYRDGQILHKHGLWPEMEERFGSPHVQIHRQALVEVLADEAVRLGVQVRFNHTVERIEDSMVKTSNGESFSADLIIGADGERSFCRQLILGEPSLPRSTGTLVYRCNVDQQRLLDDPELCKDLQLPILCSWLGPEAHAVVYSLDYNNVVTVAITCPDPVLGRVQFGPREGDINELKASLAGWDPTLLKLLDLGTDLRFWTLLQLPEENRIWTDAQSQKILLIGDAAHSMTPYIAQGASQGLEDGAFLGHLFPGTSAPSEIPNKLKLFCERRQPRAFRVRNKAWSVGSVYQLTDGPEQQARDNRMQNEVPAKDFPNPFADPFLQSWLYDYDVQADVADAIEKSTHGTDLKDE
ncbi:unnamed protein product [Clonostachys rosea]|uniref:FAD-binding domain-containing protein n=1 Tax=Bionectria ochroleuca TaxID=29856 RepID=A0ABY6ULS4_BIOOC|nr:unnamed protein product [Clonostachys rosea]